MPLRPPPPRRISAYPRDLPDRAYAGFWIRVGAALIDGLRSTVLDGVPPNWASLGAGTASSLVYLCGGFMLFKRLEVGMADIA